ncbi:hypothetical protein FKM82_019404 [Ascaphus truei]
MHPSRSGVPAADERVSSLQESWKRIQAVLQKSVLWQKKQADRLRQKGHKFIPGEKLLYLGAVCCCLASLVFSMLLLSLEPLLTSLDLTLAWNSTTLLSGTLWTLLWPSTLQTSTTLGHGTRTNYYAALSTPRPRLTDNRLRCPLQPTTLGIQT